MINSSVQLGLEQALKALIPYLKSLNDSDWEFLDEPFPSEFLFLAGHEASNLPESKELSYLGFIAGLPDNRAIGVRYPMVPIKMELATVGLGDESTRAQAVTDHSARTAALIRLFSMRYYNVLRDVLNVPPFPDTRPWQGLGFDAWNAETPADGRSPTGNAFIASPTYIFVVHFETEPLI